MSSSRLCLGQILKNSKLKTASSQINFCTVDIFEVGVVVRGSNCRHEIKNFFGVLQRVHHFAWLDAMNVIAFYVMKLQNLRITSKAHCNDAQSKTIT